MIHSASTPSTDHVLTVVAMGLLFFLLAVVVFVVLILFICGIRKTYRCIYRPVHVYPAWLAWLLLVPFLSLIFSWILLPFAIPDLVKEALKNQGSNALRRCRKLKKMGLAYCIVSTITIIAALWVEVLSIYLTNLHQGHLKSMLSYQSLIAAVVFLILSILYWLFFILYWRRLVRLRVDLLAAKEREEALEKEHDSAA